MDAQIDRLGVKFVSEFKKRLAEHGELCKVTIIPQESRKTGLEEAEMEMKNHILKNRKYVDFQDSAGNTALHYCFNKSFAKTTYSSITVASMLLDYGAKESIKIQNERKETPMDLCKDRWASLNINCEYPAWWAVNRLLIRMRILSDPKPIMVDARR